MILREEDHQEYFTPEQDYISISKAEPPTSAKAYENEMAAIGQNNGNSYYPQSHPSPGFGRSNNYMLGGGTMQPVEQQTKAYNGHKMTAGGQANSNNNAPLFEQSRIIRH